MREAMPGVVKGADGKNYIETPSSVPFAFQLEGMQGQYEGQYRQLSQQPSPISYQPIQIKWQYPDSSSRYS